MPPRAKSCQTCTPSQQRAIVRQLARSLAKCGPAKKRKRKRRPARGLAALAVTVREHFADQQRVNRTQAGINRALEAAHQRNRAAIVALYQTPSARQLGRIPVLGELPRGRQAKGRQAFTVAEAKRAARAIGAPARGIPPRQLARGMTEELEHGRRAGRLDVTHDDPTASARIALAHMRTDPAYYRHLAAMEAHTRQGVRQLPAPAAPARAPAPVYRTHTAVLLIPHKYGKDAPQSRWIRLPSHLIAVNGTQAQEIARESGFKPRKRGTYYSQHEGEYLWFVRVEPKPAAKPKRARVDFEAVEQVVEALESDPYAIPQPIGPEGYRPSQCATHAEPWGTEYEEALEEARERAAVEAGDDEELYRVRLREHFAEHPRFSAWAAVENECVRDFRSKHARRTRHTFTAADETRAALAEARAELGYDITGSAEHLDRLSLGGQAAYWRRLYKRTGSQDALRRAREIEARARARKRKGAGVSTFAVG